MDAKVRVRWTKRSFFRGVACAALLSVSLGACSSVPAALNPVKWYEKTTDFFSGDQQAADLQTAPGTPPVKNHGLSADPEAPAPVAVPVQGVTVVDKGLNSDQVASNYASPPLERQGAPRSVLQPSSPVVPTPPAPTPHPTASVASAPIAPLSPLAMRATPAVPAAPVVRASVPPLMPKRISMAGAPPPPKFNLSSFPPSAPLGGETFETVVISSDGLAMASAPRPKLKVSTAQTGSDASLKARFPNPGTTVGGATSPVRVGAMIRAATINFANNASNLDARDRSILGAVIQLQRERGGHVVVVGHASSRTKDMDYITHKMVNFEISMQRAATIGNALKKMGLQGENLEVQAVSDAEPLYTEVMPSGEAGNRRVEIYLAP